MLLILLLQFLSGFLPDVWDLTIFMSWHQGLHKLHLALTEEDPDLKEEPLIRTRGLRNPLSSNHPLTWRNMNNLTSAQQMLVQMGLQCTPKNLVTALVARLTQNSITMLAIIVLFLCYCIPVCNSITQSIT